MKICDQITPRNRLENEFFECISRESVKDVIFRESLLKNKAREKNKLRNIYKYFTLDRQFERGE